MDNDSNVRELEQLVDKLQTVNRALSSTYSSCLSKGDSNFSCGAMKSSVLFFFLAIDASLTTATSDESLI